MTDLATCPNCGAVYDPDDPREHALLECEPGTGALYGHRAPSGTQHTHTQDASNAERTRQRGR
jgi:hypothetical protein